VSYSVYISLSDSPINITSDVQYVATQGIIVGGTNRFQSALVVELCVEENQQVNLTERNI